MSRSFLVAICLIGSCVSSGSEGGEESPEARGEAIATEVDARDRGFGDTSAELTMTLRSVDGRERVRRLTWHTLEATEAGAGDKSLTVFHEPRDIEGTAFLSHTFIERDDDQWLYLPALKRVKRIASANKSSAFVGSEFAYEDLLSDEVAKFEYRWLRDEACGEQSCYVLERRPRYAGSGYSRQIVWIDQAEYRRVRIEYYDLKQRHEKTLMLGDYNAYLGHYWRAHTLHMQNHLTGKSTVLATSEYRFRTGLSERDFDAGTLRRLR